LIISLPFGNELNGSLCKTRAEQAHRAFIFGQQQDITQREKDT